MTKEDIETLEKMMLEEIDYTRRLVEKAQDRLSKIELAAEILCIKFPKNEQKIVSLYV